MEDQELSNSYTNFQSRSQHQSDSVPDAPDPSTRAVPDSFPFPVCDGAMADEEI